MIFCYLAWPPGGLGIDCVVFSLNRFLFWLGYECSTILELHHAGLLFVVYSPFWQTLTIRITCLGEVYPILLHQVAHHLLLRILIGLFVETAIQIHDVVGMGGSTTIALGIDGLLGVLGQISHINRTLTRLGLLRSPFIGWPTEVYVAHHIAKAVQTLHRSIAWINGLGTITPVVGQRVQLLVEHLHTYRVKLHGTLVAIVHNQHWHIVILTLLVERINGLGNHVAVHDGHVALEVHTRACQLLSIHLAHLSDGALLQTVHKHPTHHLSRLLVQHIHGRHPGTTLADASTEQALGQGRGTEEMTTHGTSRLAEDGHLRGVATEVLDVTLYPLQGENLVENAVVARVTIRILLGQFGMRHKA